MWNLAGRQACTALASAQVTGVDFSATSIHHTEQLKQKYNLRIWSCASLPLNVLKSWKAASIK